MNMSYVLIHIIHKASVNHPRAAAPSGPAYYRGHADSGAADKRIKDLARLSVLITYNTPINYTHTADHSPPLNHWPAAGNDKCFLFAIFSSHIIIPFPESISFSSDLNDPFSYSVYVPWISILFLLTQCCIAGNERSPSLRFHNHGESAFSSLKAPISCLLWLTAL